MNDPACWRGPEVDYRKEGLHVLSERELAEVDRALRHLKDEGDLDFPEITPDVFPLDSLGVWLAGLPARLRTGRGFALLRGLPRSRYDDDDMARIYFGLGSYVGTPRVQSHLGDLLGHVIDVSELEPGSRGYRKGGAQRMHVDSTDMCDVIGLMCLRTAKSGGLSRISSAVAVWETIKAARPDLANVLRSGFFYRRGEEDGKQAGRWQSEHRIASFTEADGRLCCYLVGSYPRRAEAYGDTPMTPLEREALEEAERLAASPEYYLDMEFADGDIQFLNNRAIFHGRTDYEDHPEIARRRHMMRLWLRVPSWPAVPPSQVFNTDDEQRRWAAKRERLAELPSIHQRHLAAKARRYVE